MSNLRSLRGGSFDTFADASSGRSYSRNNYESNYRLKNHFGFRVACTYPYELGAVRGGSWSNPAEPLRGAYRGDDNAYTSTRQFNLGFRVALENPYQIFRGGSFYSSQTRMTSSFMVVYCKDYLDNTLGFRLACESDPKQAQRGSSWDFSKILLPVSLRTWVKPVESTGCYGFRVAYEEGPKQSKRGSSWGYTQAFLPVSLREEINPYLTNEFSGFRVACHDLTYPTLRGVSWGSRPCDVYTARRSRMGSVSRGDSYGFRIARDVDAVRCIRAGAWSNTRENIDCVFRGWERGLRRDDITGFRVAHRPDPVWMFSEVRGGSWLNSTDPIRAAKRGDDMTYLSPSRHANMGFRIAS